MVYKVNAYQGLIGTYTVKRAHAVTCIKRTPLFCPVIKNFI